MASDNLGISGKEAEMIRHIQSETRHLSFWDVNKLKYELVRPGVVAVILLEPLDSAIFTAPLIYNIHNLGYVCSATVIEGHLALWVEKCRFK